jgi:hypothetical protein
VTSLGQRLQRLPAPVVDAGLAVAEGCVKSDVAYGLPVRVHGSVWWHPAVLAGEAILMLSKLAYLTLCRSIQLLVLLARGDAAKDLEILSRAPPNKTIARRESLVGAAGGVSLASQGPPGGVPLPHERRVPSPRWATRQQKRALGGGHQRYVARRLVLRRQSPMVQTLRCA